MSCKIVVPSHNRADRVLTTEVIDSPIICVEKSQEEAYKEYNPDCEIVSHPDSVKGLVPKRNWMLNHFGDLFMVDDDCLSFRKMYVDMGEHQKVDSKMEVNQRILELYDLAKTLGVHLFGFTKNPRPEQYPVFKPFSMSNCINGGAYGAIQGEHVVWNEEFKLKEDFMISCLVKHHYRKILIDNRYNFSHRETFKSTGGLAEIRNHDEEIKNILRLRKYFGDVVNLKKNRISSKLVKKYDVTVRFKF